jgi:hypothetical protein
MILTIIFFFFKAVITVSNLIARNQFERISGLVFDESINIIKTNFSKLTSEQQKSITIVREDIRFLLPYDFGITTSNGRTFAKMSVLFYYVPDSGDLIKRAKFDAKLGFELNERIKNGFIIADYR